MSKDPDSLPKHTSDTRKPSASASRQAERAGALRANLMRRKAQARGRVETTKGEAPGDERPKPPADA